MHGRRRAFDVMLRGRADSVLGAIQDVEDPEDNVAVDPSELTVPPRDLYQVINPSGRVLGAAPHASSAQLAVLGAQHAPGYFDFSTGGEHYRALRVNGMRVIDRDDAPGGLRRPVTILYASPTRDLWHEAVEAMRFYLLAGVLLLALTGIALVWFLRRRLSPLQELATVAGRVSTRSWDFVPPREVLSTAELAPIALSIESLLEGLHLAFERQRQLTGDAAHELKTSVAVVKSSLQLLSMSPRTEEQYRAGLDSLLVDTERMEELAARMLALARLEEAPAEHGAECDLALAVRTVGQRLRPIAERKGLTLQIGAGAPHEDAPYMVAAPTDEGETLCSNLMMNALQHTAAGGHVTARIEAHGPRVTLRITDDGEGIPSTALPHVFERFYRADRSRSRLSGGAGLGLSICKAIAERAGGTIRIESEAGKGTAVIVVLPLIEPQYRPEPASEPSQLQAR
jgi:signal transduction histidine kinase